MLNQEREAWSRYTRTQSELDFNDYLSLRRRCVLAIHQYKRNNQEQLLTRARNSPKLLFRYLRSQRKIKPSPLTLTTPVGELTSSPKEAADTLAEAYKSTFSVSAVPTLSTATSYLERPPLASVDFFPHEVEKLLALCDPGGSPGPDGVHPRVLRECASALSLPYSILFHTSLSLGALPSSWKQAIIHPIYKGGNRHDPSNYRPINLTAIPCKIMEKVINRRIHSYLLSHKILHPAQHGFLSSRSCLTNHTIFHDHLSRAAEAKMKIDCVFFDFSRAFDTLPHDLLIARWQDLGIRGQLSWWLQAFTLNRTVRVRVGGLFSSEFSATSGVPQGSVIGPTLFLIFINTLPSVVPQKASSLLFADDLKVWSSDPFVLQMAINECAHWSFLNRLPFNPLKTVHMSFNRQSDTTFTLPTPDGRLPIPTVNQHKDLGVWLTPNLSPSLMCLHSSKKALQMVHLLRRTFPSIDPRNFSIIYSSFVRPLLEHCTPIWLPWLKREDKSLENVQRKATKNVRALRNLTYPERLSRLKLFPLKYRRIRGCLIHTYRLLNTHTFQDLLPLSCNSQLRGHSRKLFLERCSSRPRRNFLTTVIVPFWNKLPESAVTATSVYTFKRLVDGSLPRLLYPETHGVIPGTSDT